MIMFLETLYWYAENGDIQSAVSMYIVLAGKSLDTNSGQKVLVHYFYFALFQSFYHERSELVDLTLFS